MDPFRWRWQGGNRRLPSADEQCMGQPAIAAKFAKLTFGTVAHHLTKIDAQPTPHNGVMVFVTGQLQVRCGAASEDGRWNNSSYFI